MDKHASPITNPANTRQKMKGLQRLVLPPELYTGLQLGSVVSLDRDRQHYLCRVLRQGEGDAFIAMDGDGRCWRAILRDGGAAAYLEAELPPLAPPNLPITIAAAIPKGTGFDNVVRQCAELGVRRIVPLVTARSLVRPTAGSEKLARWQRLAREACEQAFLARVPQLEAPMEFTDFLAQHSLDATTFGYICSTHPASLPLLSCLQAADWTHCEGLRLAIGPEGGWSGAEERQAIDAGYVPVSLGTAILAAVTAPVVALAIVQAVLHASNDARSRDPAHPNAGESIARHYP